MKHYSELKNYIIKDIVDDSGEIRNFVDDIDEYFLLKGDESTYKNESGWELVRKNGYIYGNLILSDGRILEYEFKDNGGVIGEDIFEGKYIVTKDNVIISKYRGCICSEAMTAHGYGVRIVNGKKYIATWINNCEAKNNLVKIILSDGSKYEGEVDCNLVPNGKGMYIFPTGERYEGDVLDTKATGKGIIKLRDGSIYKGEFLNFAPHGKGIMINSNGNILEGNFVDGSFEGPCNVTKSNKASNTGINKIFKSIKNIIVP